MLHVFIKLSNPRVRGVKIIQTGAQLSKARIEDINRFRPSFRVRTNLTASSVLGNTDVPNHAFLSYPSFFPAPSSAHDGVLLLAVLELRRHGDTDQVSRTSLAPGQAS